MAIQLVPIHLQVDWADLNFIVYTELVEVK